ncbi:MAG: STAS domain-containing protein [Pseudomonadota bacterium]
MTTIKLPARITMGEARATLAQLQPLLQAADAPVLDATALVELDTAALALLLDCQRQARARGKQLQLVGAPAKLGQLAMLYGVADLLGLQPGAM